MYLFLRRVPILCLALAFSGGLWCGGASAAVFCVDDVAGLQSALASADSNGQDDDIRLRPGTYVQPPLQVFQYFVAPDAPEPFDISVSGDWYALFGNGCIVQGNNPFTTVIDADGDGWGLRLLDFSDGESGDVSVRLLTLTNGSIAFERGAGLQVLMNGNGLIRIERNVFLANEAYAGGGLSVSGGLIQQIANNLFMLNRALEIGAGAAELGNDGAIYFTNNTVLNNESVGLSPSAVWASADLGVYAFNNNLWNNDGDDLDILWVNGHAESVVRNNNFQSVDANGLATVEDNLSVAPVYQSGLFNFTPVRGSPLVDAGTEPEFLAFWNLTAVDLNGSVRLVGEHVDIGAFENERIFANGFQTPGPFGAPESVVAAASTPY